jgi:hypothetical protein
MITTLTLRSNEASISIEVDGGFVTKLNNICNIKIASIRNEKQEVNYYQVDYEELRALKNCLVRLFYEDWDGKNEY